MFAITSYILRNYIAYSLKPLAVILCIFALNSPNTYSAEKQIVPSEGHTVTVLAVTFSPDGKYIISAGGDNTVRVWNMETVNHLKLFKGGAVGRTESVAVSPDGKFVAAAGFFDRKIRIWSLETGDQVKTFSGHSFFGAWSVAYSPNGKNIVSGGSDGTLRLWNIESGKQIFVRKGHRPGFLSDVLSVAFSPDGKSIASASYDKTICIWESETGRKLRVLKGHTGAVCSVVFDPAGKYIASGSSDGTVRLWRIESGAITKTFTGHSGMVNSVAFSPDGKYVLSGSEDKTIRLWNIHSNDKEKVYRKHRGIIYSVSFSPEGKQFISGGSDKKIILWDKKSGEILRVFERRVEKYISFGHPHFWTRVVAVVGGFFYIVFVVLGVIGEIRLEKLRQLRTFSEDKAFVSSFKQTLYIEDVNPRKALSIYKRLLDKNREWRWDIVLLATAMPVIAFILSVVASYSFDIPAWMATAFIWLPIGFLPYFTAARDLEFALAGYKDPLKQKIIQKYVIAPLLNFFWDGFQLFIVLVTAFILTILTTCIFALAYKIFIDDLSYFETMYILSGYVALPMLVVYFVLVMLVWCSIPTRILSLRRLFVAIKLSQKNIFEFIIKTLIALVLAVSITGFFHQNPLYGGVMALFIGVLFSFEDGKFERYFVPNYLLKLAEVRCLIRLEKRLEAEWHLQKLLFISERFPSLKIVKELSKSLAYLFDKEPKLSIAKDCIDDVRMIAEDAYGDIGRATILNTESIIMPIGMGTPIAERPSHTTGHTDRVSGDSAGQNRHK